MIVLMVLEWIISITIALIYFRSGIHKFRKPYSFVQIVYQYKILPYPVTKVFAPLLMIVELIVSIWLLIPVTRFQGAILGSMLQIMFICLMVKNLGKTFEYGCGCFELNVPEKITFRHISMNISILTLLISVAWVNFTYGG